MTLYYPAIITKKKDCFHIAFVDLDHCEAEGKDLEDALENARYEGVNWVLAEREETMDLPEQTHLEDIIVDENQEKTMIALLMPREGWDE